MRKFILVVCIIVFLVSGGYLAKYFYDSYSSMKNLKDIGNMEQIQDIETANGTIISKYAAIWKKNNDLIGWIKIDGTRIDFPVMQTVDNPEYYLRRDFEGEYNKQGVPFMDYKSDIFAPTSNYMIYGHNMKSGAMFHDLLKFKDPDFAKDHEIIFDTIYKEDTGKVYGNLRSGGQGRYKVVAAAYTKIKEINSTSFKYYSYADLQGEEEYKEFIKGIKAEAVYDTGINPTYGQQLITLSTCTNDSEDGRFYVVAVRVSQ